MKFKAGVFFCLPLLFLWPVQALALISSMSHSDLCVSCSHYKIYKYIYKNAGINVYQGVDIDILSEILGEECTIFYKRMSWQESL